MREYLPALREIYSEKLKEQQALIDRKKQDERITRHRELIAESEKNLQNAQLQLKLKNDSLTSEEKTLKILKSQELSLKNNSSFVVDTNQQQKYNQQLEILTKQIDEIENKTIELFTEIENLEVTSKKDTIRISGLTESESEIIQDTESKKISLQKILDQVKNRKEEILLELPQPVILLLQRAEVRNPYSFLTSLENKSCGTCKMQLSSIEQNSIDKDGHFKLCPNCQRLICPRM